MIAERLDRSHDLKPFDSRFDAMIDTQTAPQAASLSIFLKG